MKTALIPRLSTAPIHPNHRGAAGAIWAIMLFGVLLWPVELLAITNSITVPRAYFASQQYEYPGATWWGSIPIDHPEHDYPIDYKLVIYSDSDGRERTIEAFTVGGSGNELPRA